MKLLFISQYLYRPDQAASNRIYDFLHLMTRRGHEVKAIAGGVHYLEERLDPDLARRKLIDTRWGDIHVTQVYATPGFRKGIASRIRSYLSFAWYASRAIVRAEPVDAILVSIQPIFVAPLAWAVARLRGVPFLLEVRDLWPDAAAEIGLIKSPILLRLGSWLEGFVYWSAKHIVVIGPAMKRVLVAKGVDPHKIDVVPQGYRPPDEPLEDRAIVRRRLGLDRKFVLIFAGSFGLANNDVPTIIDAAALLRNEPDLKILMVGEGNQKARCIERCREEGLDHVRFLPMVPKSEIHSLLAAADAGVMTLPPGDFWKICLQNKIFDYLGTGLPVVAAVAGDQADLIREARAGIVVPPGDVRALAEAILALKRDTGLREQLGVEARRHIRAHLMRSEVIRKYAELVENVVGLPAHREGALAEVGRPPVGETDDAPHSR